MLVTYGGVSCVLAPQAAFQNEEETARLLGSIFLHTGGLFFGFSSLNYVFMITRAISIPFPPIFAECDLSEGWGGVCNCGL